MTRSQPGASMPLQLEFVCHHCQTRFSVMAGEGVLWASCPVCHVRAAVQDHVAARGIAAPSIGPAMTPPVAAAAAPSAGEEDPFADERPPRERNWVLIGGIAFLGLWGLVTAVMLLLGALAHRPAVAPAPPPPPVTTPTPPTKRPLFEVNPAPAPDTNYSATPSPPSPPTTATTATAPAKREQPRAEL